MVGRADYNEWGQITHKDALDITSSYRRIYPQLSYTGHDWDDVLGMYYAKARFYDADTKRFVAIDPIKGNVTDPLSLVPYIYCVDNPLRWVDPLGRVTITFKNEHLQGKIDLFSVSGANFSGGSAKDQYISLTDLQNILNALYDSRSPVVSLTGSLTKQHAYVTKSGNIFAFSFDGKTHEIGTSNSIKVKNNEYFIKFECLQTLVQALGIGSASNKNGKVFNPALYTSNAGKIYANTLLREKLQNGCTTFFYGRGSYNVKTVTTEYYRDYDPLVWAKQNVKSIAKERDNILKKMEYAGSLGTMADIAATGIDWFITYWGLGPLDGLSGISETPLGDVVENVKYQQLSKELSQKEEELRNAIASAVVIHERGFEFNLITDSPVPYFGTIRNNFLQEIKLVRDAFMTTTEGTLNAFAAAFKQELNNRIDEVIKQNTDASWFTKAKNQYLQELEKGIVSLEQFENAVIQYSK